MNPHFFTAPFVRFLRFAPSAASPPCYERAMCSDFFRFRGFKGVDVKKRREVL